MLVSGGSNRFVDRSVGNKNYYSNKDNSNITISNNIDNNNNNNDK